MLKENKMGVMPVKRLVISMSFPIMISMLVQALYNVVDSIFVSQVCEDALTAVSLAFPAQNLMIGVATGTGVGINALLSRSLGAKNYEKANSVAANGVLLCFFSGAIFLLFGIFGVKLFYSSQVGTDSAIYTYGVDYLSVISMLSLGVFGQVTMERLMQSTGKTTLAMITQLAGAITNIILDPIFIFGKGDLLFGGAFTMPVGFGMAAKGAAVATVIGQFVAFFIGCVLQVKYNKEIKVSFRKFKPDFRLILEIYKIGVPSIIMMAIGSVMTFLLNKILLGFSSTAAAVFGVYFKLQSFVFMPVFGLNNGVIPIIAFNYGARNKERIIKTVRFSCVIAVSIMAIGTLLMWIMPETMLRLFDASEDMMVIGVPALEIISLSFIFAGVSINLGAVFMAFGKSYFSTIVSFARQIVVLLPAAYLLSKTNEVNNVWYAFPIAELMSLLVTLASFTYVYKTIIAKLSKTKEA